MTYCLSQGRVLTALQCFADDIVPTQVLMATAFGPEEPYGSFVKLRILVNHLREDGHAVEETACGFRLVTADDHETWQAFDLLTMLGNSGTAQADLFEEVAP